MIRNLFYRVLLSLLVLAALSVYLGKNQTPPVHKTYDFAVDDYDFAGEFVDLPANYEESIYELSFHYLERPSELGKGYALRIEGHNRSDDLFMFIKKNVSAVDGLAPNTTYKIVLEVDLASNAPAGAVGIGGAPGESVYVKIGAAAVEPVPVQSSGDDWLRLNLDKSNQSGSGKDAVVVGDVTKPTNEDFETFETKTLTNSNQPLEVTTDANGSLWIFVGTDSGFEGKTTIYYTQVKITLTAK